MCVYIYILYIKHIYNIYAHELCNVLPSVTRIFMNLEITFHVRYNKSQMNVPQDLLFPPTPTSVCGKIAL